MKSTGVAILLLALLLVPLKASAGTPGHLMCPNNGTDYHWSVDQVPVKLNWWSFWYYSPWIQSSWQSQFEAAVVYAIRQWNAYAGASPWYYYAGTTTSVDSSSGEVLIKMDPSNGDYATTETFASCPGGTITRANIAFRPRSALGNVYYWNLGLGDQYTHFVEVAAHELGHTYGLNHTCLCANEKPGAVPYCSSDQFMDNQLMRCGAHNTVDTKYQGAHGPWSWDAANIRILRWQSSHDIAKAYSYDAGSSWPSHYYNLNSEKTNAPVGVTGSNANGNYVVLWQGIDTSNRVNSIRGNGVSWDSQTKITLNWGSQLGISASADTFGSTSQKMIAAYVYADLIGGQGAMDRTVDIVYSSNQGTSWGYQYTPYQTVSRPGVAFAYVSSSQKYWVLVYQKRYTRAIAVRVSTNSNLPPVWGSETILQSGGYNVGAYGGVQIACAHNSNNCQIVFQSDGSGDAEYYTSALAFLVRVARGHILTSGSPAFIVDGYEWENGFHGSGASIAQNYLAGWWHLGYTAPPAGTNMLFSNRKALLGAVWGTPVQAESTYRVGMGTTASYSSYWSPSYGELGLFYLRD